MNRKLLIILFSLLAVAVLTIGSAVPIFADDGRGHGNQGDQGNGQGGNGHGDPRGSGNGQHIGPPADNATGRRPDWNTKPPSGDKSDNFTSRKPPDWNNRPDFDNMTDNFTGRRPDWNGKPPFDNVTDNFTGRRPPDWNNRPDFDNMTDNFTGRHPRLNSNDNSTDSFISALASILNIDQQTLTDAFKQALAKILNK